MKPRVFVSPDGKHRQAVATPSVATRLRYAGWTEERSRPAPPPAPPPAPKTESKSE
ncbi:MAG: hypothetical protein ACRDMV_15300 [Streptosporangiales bacterium]